jgi:uncharacterized protein YndB with AHSA1/START domain
MTDAVMVEQAVLIDASPETVWSFWTEPARLCQWWGTDAEVVPEPGGRFRVVMAEGPVMRGAFVELAPPARLVFTFGWEQNADGQPLAPGSTRVEVTLTPSEEGTLVVLRHFDMPASHAADHRKGWAYVVGERLPAAVAAGG